MGRCDEDFKRAAVLDYLDGNRGFKTVARAHDIDSSLLRRWVEVYRVHGEAGLQRKSQGVYYSGSFKLTVLKRMWSDELTYRQILAIFNLRASTGLIAKWERLYNEGGPQALEPKPWGRLKKMPDPTQPKPTPSPQPAAAGPAQSIEDLRMENEYLRAEVAYLKKLDALVRSQQPTTRKKRKS
ncbi:Transposase [compost metagenome]